MSTAKLITRQPLALAIAIAGSLSAQAFAEELTLEKVTVTAQKREQNALEYR